MKNEALVDIYLEIGYEELVTIRGDEESICFDRHHIVNNDDGWFDGFELSWKDIFRYCKQGIADDAHKDKIAKGAT